MDAALTPRCGSDKHLLACPLSAWDGSDHHCRWCNSELTGRKQRWCSGRCAAEMGQNHWWGYARTAAVKRDDNTCRCGEKESRSHPLEVHHLAPLHTLTITVKKWRRIGYEIETRRARHADGGCWHHQDGLVSLCHDCHQAEHRRPVEETHPGQLKIEEAA